MASAFPESHQVSEVHVCPHYSRTCLILAPCCRLLYACIRCHNVQNSHPLVLRDITCLFCIVCKTFQEVRQSCRKCYIIFGEYFCATCCLHDDFTKGYFHCDDCKICRSGGRQNFFHCGKCNNCVPISMKNDHECIDTSSKRNCSLCFNNRFESSEPFMIPNCDHNIHENSCCWICSPRLFVSPGEVESNVPIPYMPGGILSHSIPPPNPSFLPGPSSWLHVPSPHHLVPTTIPILQHYRPLLNPPLVSHVGFNAPVLPFYTVMYAIPVLYFYPVMNEPRFEVQIPQCMDEARLAGHSGVDESRLHIPRGMGESNLPVHPREDGPVLDITHGCDQPGLPISSIEDESREQLSSSQTVDCSLPLGVVIPPEPLPYFLPINPPFSPNPPAILPHIPTLLHILPPLSTYPSTIFLNPFPLLTSLHVNNPSLPLPNLHVPPITPSVPVRPATSIAPRVPVHPARFIVPRVPVRPGRPIAPGVPVHPARFIVPRVPVRPGRPIAPGVPVHPARATAARLPVNPVRPIAPRLPIHSVRFIAPRLPIRPVRPNAPRF